jgi:predicted aspartyl protease
MAIIQKKIRLEGSRNSEEVDILFDSGATYSVIQPELADRLGIGEPLPKPMEFGTAAKDRILRADRMIHLNFYLDGYQFADEFVVIAGLTEPVIIGAGTLQRWRLKLDFEHDQILFDPRVTQLKII